ncbi:TPA: DUF551 domain-containing protein [Escherichia coli]|nr:DUF551 domain-containing protein [Escherichia coli]
MSKIDYQALREAAEKATPGNWWIDSHGQAMVSFIDNEVLEVFVTDNKRDAVRHEDTGNLSRWRNDNDATFIATADPAAVLALLDELEAAEKRIAELESLTAQQLTQPSPVVPAALPENDDDDGSDIDYLEPSEVYALGRTAGWNACRAAMLQGKSEQPQNAQQNIPENIPGGNSPVTPDGWISCSERMPAQDDWILIYSKHGEYMAGQVQGEYVELSDGTLSWLGNALYWMPLPEPPQEVNRG